MGIWSWSPSKRCYFCAGRTLLSYQFFNLSSLRGQIVRVTDCDGWLAASSKIYSRMAIWNTHWIWLAWLVCLRHRFNLSSNNSHSSLVKRCGAIESDDDAPLAVTSIAWTLMLLDDDDDEEAIVVGDIEETACCRWIRDAPPRSAKLSASPENNVVSILPSLLIPLAVPTGMSLVLESCEEICEQIFPMLVIIILACYVCHASYGSKLPLIVTIIWH